MNIGIVTSWCDCGAAYVSRAYAEELRRQGHSVSIYARGGPYDARGDPHWDSPDVTWGERYLPSSRISRVEGQYVHMLHLESWLRSHDIEVVLFNEEHRFDSVRRVSHLGYVVGAYIDYYKKTTVEQFGQYDLVLCNTRRHYGVFRHLPHCLYIPWGTDITLFRPRVRPASPPADDSVVFFHSAGNGGVNCRKGTDLLLKAFGQVKGKARLVVHSQAPLSKYGDAAAARVQGDTRIRFIEKTVPPPGLYHLGDVFVYPSRLEGIGLCIAEALACGLPVITTDAPPMSEFVGDGVNGLLVAVRQTGRREDDYYWPESIVDTDDLANKMQVYVNDRDLLATHQRSARKYAESNLDWTSNASQLGEHLQAITTAMAKRRRSPRLDERLAWYSEAKYVALLSGVSTVGKALIRK